MAKGTVHGEIMRVVGEAARAELGPSVDPLFCALLGHPRVAIDQAQAMWGQLAALDDDGTLGSRLGRHVTFEHGLLAEMFAAASAEQTIAGGLRVLSHHFSLISSTAEVAPALETVDGRPALCVRLLYGVGPRAPIVSQATVSFLWAAIQRTTAAPPLRCIHLASPTSGPALRRLSKLYGAPVFASRGTDALVFDEAFAQWPLQQPLPSAASTARGLRAQLQALDLALPLEEEVAKEIQVLLPEPVSIDAVAQRLGTSARSLQRRLSARGTSFRTLARATRLELARSYLRAGGLVKEVAYLCGYADSAAFSRAYAEVLGHPPEQDRR